MIQNLSQLEYKNEFITRHIGPSALQQKEMLNTLHSTSLTKFVKKILPKNITYNSISNIKNSITECDALKELRKIANQNINYKSYIGMGYSNTVTPKVILRNVLENPSWYTPYTPYQPEISQGRLEAMFNFQQLTTELTGLQIASASLLDEATAAAEAMTLAKRVSNLRLANNFFVAEDIHPHIIDVVCTRASTLNFNIIIDNIKNIPKTNQLFGVLLQQISTTGKIYDFKLLVSKLKEKKIISCIIADLMSLVILTPPGEYGADIVLGSSQRFGVPIGYGGPYAAFFAVKETLKRAMPGRIIGMSKDSWGKNALRMALQTREQHIRRDKANSNICTSQVLLANIASFYAIYHGPLGLKRIANRIHRLTTILAKALIESNFELFHKNWFDTITVKVKNKIEIIKRTHKYKINLRQDINNAIGITIDETTTRKDIQNIWKIITGNINNINFNLLDKYYKKNIIITNNLLRTTPILIHNIFNKYHSETEIMRYIYKLERKDLALNQSMIPLGSCSMKLNSTSEMIPITWNKFNNLHPFCPLEQTLGYQKLINQLSNWLIKITGYDDICMQPNSGAQGEYAGLLTINRYHKSRNQEIRNICLIPNSAHGTNHASAKMAGMSIVTISCNKYGDIDLQDLYLKAKKAGNSLSCIMITYPSTHGVYEEKIREICDIIHNYGGQVYLDGANLNAQVGITAPGFIGADISHINLHKTFCIPHGGGGPGMGPIVVKSHLSPFMPGHSIVKYKNVTNYGAISAAPFGNASILPISWMYIRMMGKKGLKTATQVAILNANYIAHKLQKHFPVLYKCSKGYVAHECILDIREIKKHTGINEIDIAKRLIDYGFHAPTISFPVNGTLMVEPTESESKPELDRFINAMLSIKLEIKNIINKIWPTNDNPLVNAPHTQLDLINTWSHPYSKQIAVFPTGYTSDKYWPTVNRVNEVYGDRNFCCSI